MNVPLSSPSVHAAEITAVLNVLSGPELSLGPRVPLFEEMMAQCAGTRYAVAVNSGTSGLHLSVKAAGIQEDDEVITSPFSFVASSNCILFERGCPVFVDIDPDTWNINPALVEAAVTEETRAILPVHVFGRPCDMSEICSIANRYELHIIEDACEAIGASFRGKPVGSFGQTGVFAFYPNKQITTGEGGVVVTNDSDIAELCRSWRNQGRSEKGGWLQHERLGYNYRLSDINCALGIEQIRRLDSILAARARVARLYYECLSSVSQLILPKLVQPDCELSWFVYVVRLQDEFTQTHRDQVLGKLRERGIGCNCYFSPIHLQPFYQSAHGYKPGCFPITEKVAARTIALPFFTEMSEAQVQYVTENLKAVLDELGRN